MGLGQFDAHGFFSALDGVRQSRGLSWKAVAKKAGISASTLTRMAQGKRPDVDTLAALVTWSGLKSDQFIRNENDMRPNTETLGEVAALLRADRNLSERDADMLLEVVKVTYEHIRSGS